MHLSPELITFFSSMIPIGELRTAIPLATGVLGLPEETAFVYAVLGNMVPVFVLLGLLGPLTNFLRRHFGFFDRFLGKLFEKTRKKHSKKFEMYEAFFLPVFVAIPLPGSGAWTGMLIAFVFGVPYWKSIGLIGIGVITAGILITLGFTSLVSLFEVLF